MTSKFLIDDGIIVWFDGPEWDAVALEAFQAATDDIVSYAQDHAPWEDRTGDAREGIEASASEDHGDVVMLLGHTVEYGLWLEVIRNGRFAIIMPTLETQGPRIIDQAVERISKARKGKDY